MNKPTLQQIAEMPFPASERALFRHYGIRPKRENEVVKNYSVEISYSWTEYGTMVLDVEAADENEAESIATDMFDDQCPETDADIRSIDVEEVGE